MPTVETLRVEVAHAWPGGVFLRELVLHPGATVSMALAACGLQQVRPELDLERAAVGIHGRKVKRDQALRDGDRIEVYRPLRIDPMQARRLRAERGKP